MDLLPSLTCRLLFASSDAWRQLADPETRAFLPSPALHGAALGGLSAAIASAAVCLRPDHPAIDFSGVVRVALAATGCGVGAAALATAVVPLLLRKVQADPALGARYASAASLPLAASGWIVALPSKSASFIALALCCALAYRSGSLGAATLLALQGAKQRRLAAWTSLVATLPALLSAPLQVVR
jgi:hypothetical protein